MVKAIKNRRGMELVTRLSSGCKISLEKLPFVVIYHLGNFDNLIQGDFWVIPKTKFVNLCKLIHDVIVIPVTSDP